MAVPGFGHLHVYTADVLGRKWLSLASHPWLRKRTGDFWRRWRLGALAARQLDPLQDANVGHPDVCMADLTGRKWLSLASAVADLTGRKWLSLASQHQLPDPARRTRNTLQPKLARQLHQPPAKVFGRARSSWRNHTAAQNPQPGNADHHPLALPDLRQQARESAGVQERPRHQRDQHQSPPNTTPWARRSTRSP